MNYPSESVPWRNGCSAKLFKRATRPTRPPEELDC
jgi:hypothetical protein